MCNLDLIMLTEKEKYEFCLKIIQSEDKRNENIENKAKFLFSIISVVFTIIFIKIDLFILLLKNINKENSSFHNAGIIILLLIFGFLLIYLLICVYKVMKIRELKNFYPKNLLTSLYSPSSQFINSNDEKDFYNAIGEHVCMTIEHNSTLINDKSKWINFGWYTLFILIVFLIILYSIITI